MESDGIDEAFHGMLTVALAAAARAAEITVRAREQRHREAEARNLQEARELRARAAAEQAAASAQLARVHHSSWWDQASREEIAHAYQQALEWAGQDAAAAHARDRIANEVRVRYGVDLTTAGVEALADKDPQQPGQDRDIRAEELTADRAAADLVLASADLVDAEQAANQAAGDAAAGKQQEPGYDSAQRRAADRAEMIGQGIDEQAVDARVRADVGQGRPAAEATSPPGTAPKARKTRSAGAGRARTRKGLSR